MAVIDTDVSGLKLTANRLSENAVEYNAAAAKISTFLGFLDPLWEGEAKAAFMTEQRESLKKCLETRDRLRACASAYRYAAERYAEADDKARQLIRAANS